MLISGVERFTLLDYPGKTAAILFTAGCTFRCGFCHNPEFVLPDLLATMKDSFIPEEAVLNFLQTRQGLLDGVVISGGEPTVQPDLLSFIAKIKAMGFLVKLDTNGNRPEIVEQALADGLLNYIAMDVKTSLKHYPELAGSLVKPDAVKKSIDVIRTSGIPYEFRSTLIKEVHSKEILEDMRTLLSGSEQLFLQTFRPGHTLLPAFQDFHPFSIDEMQDLAAFFGKNIRHVAFR